MVFGIINSIIRYGISSGAVLPRDILSNESITRCTLSGNLCTVLCDKVRTTCFYKQYESRGLTLGQIYVLSKMIQNKLIDDKEFFHRIWTGKSLFEDMGDEYEFEYTPMENFCASLLSEAMETGSQLPTGEDNQPEVQEGVVNTGDEIMDNTYRIIREKELPKVQKRKEDLQAMIGTSKEIPSFVKQTYRVLLQGVKSVKYFGFKEYFAIVLRYIKGNTEYTEDEIQVILQYLVLKFLSKDNNDFPVGSIKTTDKLVGNLINKTRSYPDSHPCKWTKERYHKVLSIQNGYQKFVYFSDYMFLWKMYALDNMPVSELMDADIRLKYLLDQFVQSYCHRYVTDYVLFEYQSDPLVFKRFTGVISYMKEIYEENILSFSVPEFSNFFLETQINNQYIFNKEYDHKKLYKKMNDKYEKILLTSDDIFKHLSEENMLDVITVL